MKKFLTIFITSCVLINSTTSSAATVAWGAAIDTGIIDTGSAALAQGNYVRIGYFGTLTNAQIQADATTPAGITALNADFHEFANTTIGTNTSAAGSFSINSSPTYASLSGFTPSSQMYFWALDSTNHTSLSNALSTVTQTAIAYVPLANNSNWQFPATDIAATKSPDIKDLSNANAVFLAGSYVSGTTASLTPIFSSPNHALQLATVGAAPEPSRIMYFGIALLGLIWRRRR
jgi:hypothetical protein